MNRNIDFATQTPYLRTQRLFPKDLPSLVQEIDKAYVDTAIAVNQRINGIFPTNKPAITGEQYYFTTQKQQTIRKVFTFTTTGPINHNIQGVGPGQFTNCWGEWTDGTNGYGLIFGSNVAIAGQLSFYLTTSQIIFLSGAGVPSLVSGFLVLTWLSEP